MSKALTIAEVEASMGIVDLAVAKNDPNLAAFTIFSMEPDEIAELRADMGMGSGQSMGRFDLPKIKMPSAGLLQFILPDGSTAKTIRGIIVAFKDTRIYYSNPDTQGTPPDCTSEDCVAGFGKIRVDQQEKGTFECARCPHNQWGSHPKGTGGKACSERRLLAFQMEEGLVPVLVNLPVTSVKPIVETMRAIVNQHKAPINNFILTLGLTEKMNSKGIKYAIVQVEPGSITPISAEMKPVMKGLRSAAQKMLDTVPQSEIVQGDFVETEGFDNV
jgi:hypothetical protein